MVLRTHPPLTSLSVRHPVIPSTALATITCLFTPTIITDHRGQFGWHCRHLLLLAILLTNQLLTSASDAANVTSITTTTATTAKSISVQNTSTVKSADFVPSDSRAKRNTLFGKKRSNLIGGGKSHVNNSVLQHYLEPVLANPNYWIADRYHENVVCLLAAFSGIVRIRPANSTFKGGTFSISPEDSLGRRANCERNSRNIFWKFSQHEEHELVPEDEDDDDEEEEEEEEEIRNTTTSVKHQQHRKRKPKSFIVVVERSNKLLSAGFHVVGSVIEFHIAYIECLQKANKNVLTNRYRIQEDSVCTNLSVSFDLGSFGDRLAYECSHIWSKTLKDVHYNHDKRHYSGEVQISLKVVRIDKDPLGVAPYSFRRVRRRCAWDTLLSWQSLTITGSLLVIFVVGFFGLCVCSNSSCHDDSSPASSGGDSSSNWCCHFCWCSCRRAVAARRRRRQSQARVEYSRQVNLNRPNCNHHHHQHHHHGHTQAPPPPPPPSSSTSLLTNTSSHPNHVAYTSRRANFSNSYSYEGTGSNPTQPSSSSAMSTAIDDYYYYSSTPTKHTPLPAKVLEHSATISQVHITIQYQVNQTQPPQPPSHGAPSGILEHFRLISSVARLVRQLLITIHYHLFNVYFSKQLSLQKHFLLQRCFNWRPPSLPPPTAPALRAISHASTGHASSGGDFDTSCPVDTHI